MSYTKEYTSWHKATLPEYSDFLGHVFVKASCTEAKSHKTPYHIST